MSNVRKFIRPGNTDLRKLVNGLTRIVQDEMKQDPINSEYIFCNRDRKLIKAVYWDYTGFWLCQKRLEKEKYPWPLKKEEARELNIEELKMLLSGIDFFKTHKILCYRKVPQMNNSSKNVKKQINLS